MACFGWIAPGNLLQAGREDLLEQGGCGRALEQGEALESLGGFGVERLFGVVRGGKSDFSVDPAEPEGS